MAKIKATDYLAKILVDKGVSTTFGLTGGAVVHILDSIDKQEGITTIFNHHEQASSFAAVSYARLSGMGVCIVTTGPAGTNALTGVLAAWQDSIPCLFISGQSRRSHMSRGKGVRQIGVQEFDIVPVVEPMTKYAAVIEKPEDIKEQIDIAWHHAVSGRPGPVWLDIPLDIQYSELELDDDLSGVESIDKAISKPLLADKDIDDVVSMMRQSVRPILLIGYGARLSGAEKELQALIELCDLPYIASWTARDILPSDHRLYVGNPGIVGQRGANMAMQNADLLICIGSHLNMGITGSNFDAFARDATTVLVNIDENELHATTVKIDKGIHADAKEFCTRLTEKLTTSPSVRKSAWLEKCKRYSELNKIAEERVNNKNFVDPFYFMERLSGHLGKEPVVVDGGGTSLYASCQSVKLKQGQRILLSSAISSMGSGLPEAIGACMAVNKQPTICTIGDGSMQLNVQELQTMVTYQLPIKIFVLNNSGYLAIRHTQDGFLGGRHVGTDSEGYLDLPDFKKIADVYGLATFEIKNNSEIDEVLNRVLATSGPVLCELHLDKDGTLQYTQGFIANNDGTFRPSPLEDMAPFISRDEFLSLMEIEPWE